MVTLAGAADEATAELRRALSSVSALDGRPLRLAGVPSCIRCCSMSMFGGAAMLAGIAGSGDAAGAANGPITAAGDADGPATGAGGRTGPAAGPIGRWAPSGARMPCSRLRACCNPISESRSRWMCTCALNSSFAEAVSLMSSPSVLVEVEGK